jgi:hypothetical protein
MEDLETEAATARRVYLCPNDDSIFCLVSPEDYDWVTQWCWQYTWDRHKRKRYATRSTTLAGGRRLKIYLHKAILADRKQSVPPSAAHTIGDHQDGDSLNNCRDNLEWATASMNALNRRRIVRPANDNNRLVKAA